MSIKYFQTADRPVVNPADEIKETVLNEIDCTKELSDKEVLDIIDKVLLQKSRSLYLSLSEKVSLRQEVFFSLRRYDILQPLINDDSITEIMINGTKSIFYEKAGRIYKWDRRFTSEEKLEDVIQKIVSRTNRMVNEKSPIVDTRLENGSRVNVVLSPVSLDGSSVTIRRFPDNPITMKNLIELGSLSEEMSEFLKSCVKSGKNILICGGTGTGKTTFLNALTNYIEKDERVVTIEDSAELQIRTVPNLVRLECREANTQGVGEISIRRLIKTALRMRPDRLIIGEVRGGEAVDLLQALNTGHAGSLSTIHANSCEDVFSRLETMVLMGMNIPLEAIRRQIGSAIQLLVHLVRMKDKSRKVNQIARISGYKNGEFIVDPVYVLEEGGWIKNPLIQ